MSQKIRTVLIDDEELVLDNLSYLLEEFPRIETVFKTTNPAEALDYIEAGNKVEVVFLDICMPEKNGIELAEDIFAYNPGIKIVFLTAYDSYVMDSFRVNTFDYILKPVTYKRLSRMVEKLERLLVQEEPIGAVANQEEQGEPKIVGFKDNQFYIFDAKDACYIMVDGRDLLLITENETYRIKHNMNYWEERLKHHDWFRCHRGYLVNLKCVKAFTPMFNSTYSIKLKNRAEEIPVSRYYVNEFKKILSL